MKLRTSNILVNLNEDPHVSGRVSLYFDLWIPDEKVGEAGPGVDMQSLKDAVMEALPDVIGLHLWGPSAPPLGIQFRVEDDDVEVWDDNR